MKRIMNRSFRFTFGVLLALAFLGFSQHGDVLAAAKSPEPMAKVMSSYGGEAGYQAPLWIAHNLKLFAKQGINSEIVRIAGGSRSSATLLSNSTQISQGSLVSAIQATLAGGDLVAIATSTNRPAVSVIVQPKSVKTPRDLAGKKIGLVSRGAWDEFFLLKALKQWGVDPKTITMITIPGSQLRLVAVAEGTIDATLLAPPATFEADKLLLTTLMDFSTASDSFPQCSLTVRRDFLSKNRDLLKRYLMAYTEAIHVMKTDPDKTLPVMKQYTRTKDDLIARRSYDYYAKLLSQPPLTDEKGVAFVLDFLSNETGGAGAKNLKPADFIDNSLLAEIQREGFFSRLK